MFKTTRHSRVFLFLLLCFFTLTTIASSTSYDLDQPQPYGYEEGLQYHKRMDVISNALDRAETIIKPKSNDSFKDALDNSYDSKKYRYNEEEYAETGYRYVDEFDGKKPASSTIDWISSIMDYGFIVETDQKPTFYFDSFLPMYTSPDKKQAFFAQHRVSRHGDLGTLLSLGFGYRQLLANNTFIAGANAFVDYSSLEDHSRAGLGLEAIANYFEARANYYHGLSSRREVGAWGTETFEKVVNGFDLEAGGTIPFATWIKLFAGYQRYFHTKTPDKKGWKSRAQLTPFKFASVNLEAYSWENADNSYRMEGQVHVPFSSFRPSDIAEDIKAITSKDPHAEKPVIDLTPRMLERVHRNFVIAKERWDGDNSQRLLGNLHNIQLVVRFPSTNPVDIDTNGNGFVDAGETFEIDFLLTNNTSSPATGISFSNATTSLGPVDINDGDTLADAPPGGTSRTDNASDMDFTIPVGTAAGTQFTFSLTFTADGYSDNFTFGPFIVGSLIHGQVIDPI